MHTTTNPLRSILRQGDARHAEEARHATERYAQLLRRAADNKLEKGDTFEAVEKILEAAGKSRDDLDGDIRTFDHLRSERRGATTLLDVLRAHRDTERVVRRALAALSAAIAAGHASIKAGLQAEEAARARRPGTVADSILRRVPGPLRSAFLAAEACMVSAEDDLEAGRDRGATGPELETLTQVHAAAERAAHDAWARVLEYDPTPLDPVVSGERVYEPRTIFDRVVYDESFGGFRKMGSSVRVSIP